MRKLLLAVGINKYKNPANNLNGCINDVEDVVKTFGRFNYEAIKLLNEQATKAHIITELTSNLNCLQAGDKFVFYYSGHGAQVVDTSGDEVDKLDEILCPYDFDWTPERYIVDDEIGKIIAQAPIGITIDFIIDACHSGSITRDLMKKSKFINNPNLDLWQKTIEHRINIRKIEHKKMLVHVDQYALWSACQDDQTSIEKRFGWKIRGLFTKEAMETIRLHPHYTREDLFIITNRKMAGNKQNPFLTCPQSYLKTSII